MSATVRDQPVIVVSTTRSGSTLLQRILNAHPQITIWGEHMGILSHLGRAMAAADAASANLTRGYAQRSNLVGDLVDAEPFSEHINPFDVDELRTMVRAFVRQLFAEQLPPDTTWGFKEVRYFGEDLEFIGSLFPDARFIVLAREPAAQISSYLRAPWRRKPDLRTAEGIEQLRETAVNAARNWTRQYESFRQFVVGHEAASILVTFDQLTDPRTIASVFAHVGRCPPADGSVESVMRRRTGSSDRATAWSAGDRAILDRVIATTTFPAGHEDVVGFFFDDQRALT